MGGPKHDDYSSNNLAPVALAERERVILYIFALVALQNSAGCRGPPPVAMLLLVALLVLCAAQVVHGTAIGNVGTFPRLLCFRFSVLRFLWVASDPLHESADFAKFFRRCAPAWSNAQ